MVSQEDRCWQVLATLKRIIRGVDLHSKALVRSCGLTGPQLILLEELSRLGKASVGTVAKNISLSHATVTDMLNRLERSGFVSRYRCDSDRRRVEVEITESGTMTIQQAPPLLQERFVARFQRLEDWEQSLILSCLQRIASMMEAPDIDEPAGPVDHLLDDSRKPRGVESVEGGMGIGLKEK